MAHNKGGFINIPYLGWLFPDYFRTNIATPLKYLRIISEKGKINKWCFKC